MKVFPECDCPIVALSVGGWKGCWFRGVNVQRTQSKGDWSSAFLVSIGGMLKLKVVVMEQSMESWTTVA